MRVASRLLSLCLCLAACSKQPPSDAASDASGFPRCVHPVVTAVCHDGWCRLPGGCFAMGSPTDEWCRGRENENLVDVTLTHAFLMQQAEFSQASWTALGFPNPSSAKTCAEPGCPVDNVSWFEALAAANAMSRKNALPECYSLSGCTGEIGTGMQCTSVVATTAAPLQGCRGYRLPTEAEWEYAVRAGTRSAFSGGDITPQGAATTRCVSEPGLEPFAWYCTSSVETTQPGGRKASNGWGLFDLAGNAGEWVNDTYTPEGYGVVPLTDPVRLAVSDEWGHAVRGAAFNSWPCALRSAARLASWKRGPALGFRLVRTVE